MAWTCPTYGCSDITEVVSWLLNTEAADVMTLGREFHSRSEKDFRNSVVLHRSIWTLCCVTLPLTGLSFTMISSLSDWRHRLHLFVEIFVQEGQSVDSSTFFQRFQLELLQQGCHTGLQCDILEGESTLASSGIPSFYVKTVLLLAQNTLLMMSHSLIHLPPAHHSHPPSHIHCSIPGSKLTFSTNLFHHSPLAPTWTAFSDYTGPERFSIFS